MRLLPLVTLLVAGTLRAAESPFDYPVASRRAEFQAIFTKVDYPERQREGTKLAIKDRDGKTLFEHELDRDVARNAEWTHDSKFLIITAQNGGGPQPWRYSVYVFSLDAREIREFREPENMPVVVSAEMFFQPPHTVILIGHTFEHHMEAPEDPVLLRFDLAALWPKLQKV
jgi:hypothetical protein